MHNKIIETRGLILRKAVKEDFESLYYNYWSQEESCRYMFWETSKSIEEAKSRIERTIRFQQKHLVSFVVFHKESKQTIGLVGFFEKEKGIYEDCGIGIGKEFVGKGYGKQILNSLIDYIFNELDGKTIICNCDKNNLASKNLLKSCGFTYTHEVPSIYEKDNKKCVVEYYEISKKVSDE